MTFDLQSTRRYRGVLLAAMLLLAGCKTPDGVIMATKSFGNMAPTETVAVEKFLEEYAREPAYPVFNEFKGLSGNYFYVYHYGPPSVGRNPRLLKMYRIHRDQMPGDFLAWYEQTWAARGPVKARRYVAEPEPEEVEEGTITIDRPELPDNLRF